MKSSEYNAWRNMKTRCYWEKGKAYANYGGRGIRVCDEWCHDFDAFYAHIGKRPTPKHELDRIDNDGNYEPGNVRWATRSQQAINRRLSTKNKSGYPGIHWGRKKWIVQLKRDQKVQYIGVFKDINQAVKARENALKQWADAPKEVKQ